jgi:membrane protein DedA with SNARE-associated domain
VLTTAQLFALAASVLVGTSIPFVPTGEMVSGAAALAAQSLPTVVWVFLIAWLCSVLGDTVLMLAARRTGGPLQAWLARRTFGQRVLRAQQNLTRNAFSAIVTARMIPGGRAPVIIALGLGRFPVRRFVRLDIVACALWAAIFATIGSVGGSLTANPLWGMALAVVIALSLGVVVPRLGHLVLAYRRRAVPTVGRTPEAVLVPAC